jgi:hypothetical protein
MLLGARRRVLGVVPAVIVGALVVAYALSAAAARAASNPIVAENSKPGTPGWDVGPPSPTTMLDGYSSEVSSAPGGTIHLHVTGAAGERYRIEVYRLGWYSGVGARRVACVPSCTGDEAAASQPPTQPPAADGYLDAGWPVTDVVIVGSNWVSGVYEAKLTVTSHPGKGLARFVPFIVYEPTPRSPILVHVGVNTWQAYNTWGGRSLYGPGVTQISFNRPYAGANRPLQWEYQLIRFLESRGYWVSYASDVETDKGIDALNARRLVIDAGHDEYWTKAMRDAFDAAQASRVNTAFIGADDGGWQMRYADNYRTIVEYRTAGADPDPDPTEKTVRFRQLVPPRPECQLMGEMFLNGGPQPSSSAYLPVAGSLANRWFSGSGLTPSTLLYDTIGYEWDTAGQPACPHVQKLFSWTGSDAHGNPGEADAVTFTAPSGARVFDAGSLQFTWGLDSYPHHASANPGLQVFTQNVINDLSGTPAARPSASIFALAGLAVGKPRLSFAVAAGVNAPPIASFTITLPRGLSFSRSPGRGLKLSGAGAFTYKLLHGRLVVTLATPARALFIGISGRALVESRSLTGSIDRLLAYNAGGNHHRKKTLRLKLGVRATDAAGIVSRLTAAATIS